MALPPDLTSPPPSVPNVLTTFPAPHVILITLNRPDALNAVPRAQHAALLSLYDWYDAQPSLRAAVITGTGRAFCAGADLKEWHSTHSPPSSVISSSSPSSSSSSATPPQKFPTSGQWPPTGGFGGLSNRKGKKPIIAAINGLCLGGGFEMVINTDLVYALETAKFGLPEVTRGVVAVAGALPRLVYSVGRQRATEMVLLGGMYTARQMQEWGLVNGVVEGSDPDKLIKAVLEVATRLASNSPDAVIVSREGLMSAMEPEGPQEATLRVEAGIYRDMESGGNMKEGVQSFIEKRQAIWTNSKL